MDKSPDTAPTTEQPTGPATHETPSPIATDQPAANPATPQQPSTPEGENPDKHYLVALLLSVLFGTMGLDRMYLGKTATGFLKLFTLGGLGIWSIIDSLLIAFGALKAKEDDRPLSGFTNNLSWVKTSVIAVIVYYVVVIVFSIVMFVTIASTANFSEGERVRPMDRGPSQRQLLDSDIN